MLRPLYLAALLVLQLALVVKFAPPLAQALKSDVLTGLAPAGWPATLQLVATGLAASGAALALVFPALALARHRRAGAHRFLGLSRWAVTVALAGAALLAAASPVAALASLLPADIGPAAALVARSAVAAGLAMAAAGVLCAELLRRSVAAVRGVHPGTRRAAGRIEVTYPPELRTRAEAGVAATARAGPA